jgi:hypothetical protein
MGYLRESLENEQFDYNPRVNRFTRVLSDMGILSQAVLARKAGV